MRQEQSSRLAGLEASSGTPQWVLWPAAEGNSAIMCWTRLSMLVGENWLGLVSRNDLVDHDESKRQIRRGNLKHNNTRGCSGARIFQVHRFFTLPPSTSRNHNDTPRHHLLHLSYPPQPSFPPYRPSPYLTPPTATSIGRHTINRKLAKALKEAKRFEIVNAEIVNLPLSISTNAPEESTATTAGPLSPPLLGLLRPCSTLSHSFAIQNKCRSTATKSQAASTKPSPHQNPDPRQPPGSSKLLTHEPCFLLARSEHQSTMGTSVILFAQLTCPRPSNQQRPVLRSNPGPQHPQQGRSLTLLFGLKKNLSPAILYLQQYFILDG